MRSPLSPSMFGLFSVLLDPEFEALFGGGVEGTVLALLIGLALALLEPCTGLAGPLLPGSLLIPLAPPSLPLLPRRALLLPLRSTLL